VLQNSGVQTQVGTIPVQYLHTLNYSSRATYGNQARSYSTWRIMPSWPKVKEESIEALEKPSVQHSYRQQQRRIFETMCLIRPRPVPSTDFRLPINYTLCSGTVLYCAMALLPNAHINLLTSYPMSICLCLLYSLGSEGTAHILFRYFSYHFTARDLRD